MIIDTLCDTWIAQPDKCCQIRILWVFLLFSIHLFYRERGKSAFHILIFLFFMSKCQIDRTKIYLKCMGCQMRDNGIFFVELNFYLFYFIDFFVCWSENAVWRWKGFANFRFRIFCELNSPCLVWFCHLTVWQLCTLFIFV